LENLYKSEWNGYNSILATIPIREKVISKGARVL